MKTLFTVVITLLVTYGGYRAYQIYQDDRQLVSTLAGKLDKAEQKLGQVESTLEKKRVAEAQAKLNRISALKADIERQERLISELDRKISALDVGRTNSVADQLIDELRYQQSRVSVLEEQLREYKSGIAREDSDLKSIRTQGSAQKRAVLRSYQDQINRQQDALRTLREKLRDHHDINFTLQDRVDAGNQYKAAQSQFAALKSQYEVAKRADYSNVPAQGQMANSLASARMDQKYIEQALNVERKRLKDLQSEGVREDKSTADRFKARDKLQNQLQNENNKLTNMRERLAALTQ